MAFTAPTPRYSSVFSSSHADRQAAEPQKAPRGSPACPVPGLLMPTSGEAAAVAEAPVVVGSRTWGCCSSGKLRRCCAEVAAGQEPLPPPPATAQEPLPPPTGHVPLPPPIGHAPLLLPSTGAMEQGPPGALLLDTPAREDRCLFFSSRRLANLSCRLAGVAVAGTGAVEGVAAACTSTEAPTAVVAAIGTTTVAVIEGAEATKDEPTAPWVHTTELLGGPAPGLRAPAMASAGT